jgi:hypothetical protein
MIPSRFSMMFRTMSFGDYEKVRTTLIIPRCVLLRLWLMYIDSKQWEFIGSGSSHPEGTEWPSRRTSATLYSLDGSLYLIGKKEGDIWQFSPSSNTFQEVQIGSLFAPDLSKFSGTVVNGSLWGIVGSDMMSNSVPHLWQFDPRQQCWIAHGRLPVGADSISDSSGKRTIVPKFTILSDNYRGRIVVMEAASETVNEFFLTFDPSTPHQAQLFAFLSVHSPPIVLVERLWSRFEFSGRLAGPITSVGDVYSISSQQSHLQFLISPELGAPWPNPAAFAPPQLKVVDTKNQKIVHLPDMPVPKGFSTSFGFVAPYDARSLIAIGGQVCFALPPGLVLNQILMSHVQSKDTFEMWIYNMTACPSDCGASTGHGKCIDNAYCECADTRYGDDLSCSADCGEAGCGPGYCSSGQAGPKCQCPFGFIGDRCEVPFRCENRGQLRNINGNATCKCPDFNFLGDRCQLRTCILSPPLMSPFLQADHYRCSTMSTVCVWQMRRRSLSVL